MGESQILAHLRRTDVTYLRNTSQKDSRQNVYVISMKYYFK